MSKKYVGVTLGPVSGMIEHATNPLSMWFSSYMVSSKLTRSTCVNIFAEKDELFKWKDFDILYPYYFEEEEEEVLDTYDYDEEEYDEEYDEEDDEPYVSDEES